MRSVLTALCLFASTAHAVPAQFTHQGRLLDADGAPLEDEATITFRVTDSESGGTALWEDEVTVLLTNGFYSAVLGASEDNPLDTDVLSHAPVWLELQLEGEGTMFPRSPINAVPYATMATVAEEVSGGPVDASQIAVDGTPVVNELGEWVGPAPTVNWSDIEGVPEGFADGTDTDSFAALGTSCLDGNIPAWESVVGAWVCGIDSVLTEDEVDSMVMDNGYAMASEVFSSSFLDLTDLPDGLEDGDDNTQLTETEVDDMVSDNGYTLATETEDLLVRIALLEEQLAEVADAVADASESDVGTVMYGDYHINNSADLAVLEGYEEVSGNLAISGNVPNIESLESLTHVGGNLTISNGDALTSLRGLDNLTAIGGTLNISNEVLTSLDGLGNLSTANGLNIHSNSSLVSLAGLDGLLSVDGDVWINSNYTMTSLDGLDNLNSIEGQLHIYSQTELTSVTGLASLTTIGDLFALYDNPSITGLTGLEALTSTGSFNITRNNALLSLEGLSGLTHVNGSLDINSNAVLPVLTGLNNLTVITDTLTVQRNPALLSLEGLSGLTSMARLTVQINENLTSLDGLDSLEALSESLTIFANDSLCRSTALSFRDWAITLGIEGWNINSNDTTC